MRKVLFFAYGFPRRSAGGVQRTTKVARYLTEFGEKATVVTPDCGTGGGGTEVDEIPLADVGNIEKISTGKPVTAFSTLTKRVLHLLHRTPGGWRWCPTLRANVLYPDRHDRRNMNVLGSV